MSLQLRRGGAAEAVARLDAAREFLEESARSQRTGHTRAAVSNAATSALASADAIAYVRFGERSAGSSHWAALSLLELAGEDPALVDGLRYALELAAPSRDAERFETEPDTVESVLEGAARLLRRAEALLAEQPGAPTLRAPADPLAEALRRRADRGRGAAGLALG